ncbi:hypothetical protein N9A86_04670 [Akkermansiaceae bacterium]|nr:hypothetical protein [Akkermansiaceae bacterium]MDB4537711.1 hypothetical protein [Akkermansiaceae bacterium]
MKREDLRCVFKGGLVARPGQSSTLKLGCGLHSVSLELESGIGANEDYIDMRGRLHWIEGKETRAQWLSGITLISDKKQIVSSYLKDGKWYAILIEPKAEWMSDWLLGE